MIQINGNNCVPLFAVQDVKSSIFTMIPGGLQLDTDEAGIRHFVGVLRQNYASFYNWYNPHDYRLFRVGYFDVDNGQIIAKDLPELIFDGASLDFSDWERNVFIK